MEYSNPGSCDINRSLHQGRQVPNLCKAVVGWHKVLEFSKSRQRYRALPVLLEFASPLPWQCAWTVVDLNEFISFQKLEHNQMVCLVIHGDGGTAAR
jgi:hypothetical protein